MAMILRFLVTPASLALHVATEIVACNETTLLVTCKLEVQFVRYTYVYGTKEDLLWLHASVALAAIFAISILLVGSFLSYSPIASYLWYQRPWSSKLKLHYTVLYFRTNYCHIDEKHEV